MADYPQGSAGVDYPKNELSILKEIVNDGLPIVHVFPYKMACMSYLLFDIEELFIDEAQTMTELQLRVKNLGNGQFTPVYTNDNCAMEWREEIHAFDYTTVVSATYDGAASTDIVVSDISRLKGLGANTRVRFYTEATPFTAGSPGSISLVPSAIDAGADTITVAGDYSKLNAGDRVYRGANLRLRCATIDNQFDLNKRAKYLSYFQSLQGRVEFETCELSTDRAVYTSGKNPQFLVNSKVNAMFENLLQVDFMDAFLYGENVEQSGSTPSQTRGLLSSLQDAQVVTGNAYIVDILNAQGTTDDEAVITILIEFFIKAFESGYYNSEAITAIINTAQLKELMYMAPSFEEYFGIQMYRETPSSHEGCRDYVSLRVHGIEIEHGAVEFVLFEPLNSYFYGTPIMMLMPKSMFGMYQRKYSRVDSNAKVQGPETSYPRFKLTDISDKINLESGGDECFAFITKMEVGFIQAGIYNDAYYVIKNAKSYKSGAFAAPVTSAIVGV
jgi:hypothetical protein